MENPKEKVEEKVIPSTQENPKEEALKDTSENKETPKSDPKSEESVSDIEKLKNDLKAQANFTSEIQKKLNESNKIIESFKSAFIQEGDAETDVVTAEVVKTQLEALRQEIANKDAEIVKNARIDALNISDSIKRELKRRVKASDDIEKSIEDELESITSLIDEVAPKTRDSRPKGIGAASGNSTDADYVLSHPEQFK